MTEAYFDGNRFLKSIIWNYFNAMNEYIVVDTNIILGNLKSVYNLLNRRNIKLCIPFVVRNEIRSMLKSTNPFKRRQSIKADCFLNAYYSNFFHQSIKEDNEKILCAISCNDDRILNYGLQLKMYGYSIKMYSNDIQLIKKCNLNGIQQFQYYENQWNTEVI